MLVIVIGGALLLHLTRFGANVYALGGNRTTASLMGVAVGKMTIKIYMLSSLLAGSPASSSPSTQAPAIRSPPSVSSSTPSPPS